MIPTTMRLAAAAAMCLLLASWAAAGEAPASSPQTGPKETFHIYLLMGQSNMAGRGQVAAEDKTVHPRVFMFNRERKWAPAADPLHFDKSAAGVGPGLAFGKAMADRDPSVRIGLVPCAVGGTSISKWLPGAKDSATGTHPYDDAVARARAAVGDGVLKGIIWHQGEGDSSAKSAPLYGERLAAFIERLRKDLGAPDVPFVAAGLGDFVVSRNAEAGVVNQAMERLAGRVKNYAFVNSLGLKDKGDRLHFDAASARELGRRYAEAMAKLAKP
jgi:hypothetical protein